MNWIKAKFEQFRAWLIGPLPSVEMYKAMEKKQKERYDDLVARQTVSHQKLVEVIDKCNASTIGCISDLAKLLEAAHVLRQPPVFEYTDWDSAQVAAMIEMQRNPEKEH